MWTGHRPLWRGSKTGLTSSPVETQSHSAAGRIPLRKLWEYVNWLVTMLPVSWIRSRWISITVTLMNSLGRLWGVISLGTRMTHWQQCQAENYPSSKILTTEKNGKNGDF